MFRLKVEFKLTDLNPLPSFKDEQEAIKTILKREFSSKYDFIISEIDIEQDCS